MAAHRSDANLPRLLRALGRPTLLRLCRVCGVRVVQGAASRARLVETLEQDPHVLLGELVASVLRKAELVQACRQLGLATGGRRSELAWRVSRSLRWRPFGEARAFAQSLGLRSTRAWRAYTRGDLADTVGKRPADVPANPCSAYRDAGWGGYGDWLGTGTVATRDRVYWPYSRAERFVHSLGLSGEYAWRDWLRGNLPGLPSVPAELPRVPAQTYADRWDSWGTWLGTGSVSNSHLTFLSFDEARRVSREQGFSRVRRWRDWQQGKRPGRTVCPGAMPSHPWETFELEGWQGWEDFLGPNFVVKDRPFRPFGAARLWVRSLRLSTSAQYKAWIRGGRPDLPEFPRDLPTNPNRSYSAEWEGWGDFLGTGAVAPACKVFRKFREARAFVRGLGLRSGSEWRVWCRGDRPGLPPRPPDVPAAPDKVYAAAWQGWRDWLGTVPNGRG